MNNENVLNGGGVSTQASSSNVNIKSGDNNASSNLSVLSSVGDSATVTLDSTYTGNIYRISDNKWSGFIPNGEFLWHIDITDGKVTTHEVFVQNARYETLGTESLTIDGAIKELKTNADKSVKSICTTNGLKMTGDVMFFNPSVRDSEDKGLLKVIGVDDSGNASDNPVALAVKQVDSILVSSLGGQQGPIDIDTSPTDFGNIKFKMKEDSNAGTVTLTGTVQGVDEIMKTVVFDADAFKNSGILDDESTRRIYKAYKNNNAIFAIYDGKLCPVSIKIITSGVYDASSASVTVTGLKFTITIYCGTSIYEVFVGNATVTGDDIENTLGEMSLTNSQTYDYIPSNHYSANSQSPLTSSGVQDAMKVRDITVNEKISTIINGKLSTITLDTSSVHRIVLYASSGTQVYMLPTSPRNGETFEFYKVDSNTLTVDSLELNILFVKTSSALGMLMKSVSVDTSERCYLTFIWLNDISKWLYYKTSLNS